MTDCAPGSYVSNTPSATEDRVCELCDDGTYTDDENEAACAAWTPCPEGYVEDEPGTATSDRTCKGDEWTRQFGVVGEDISYAVGVDASGNTYVAGVTRGALPGQTSAGGEDAFLRKYDSTGATLWTQQFGSSGFDQARSLWVDGSGSVYVAGLTSGTLPGGTSAGGVNAFVRKYDGAGNVQWTWQFGTGSDTRVLSMSVDGSGNVYVAGQTLGAFPGQTNAGIYDAFVRKYDSAGAVQWTRQFGANYEEYAESVSVDGVGHVYVAGYAYVAALETDAFVRKYDGTGVLQWARQFGTTDSDAAHAARVDGNGNVYVAGFTYGQLPAQASAGGVDAFLRKYDGAGAEQWTRQIGSDQQDRAYSVSVDGSGSVYVAGYTGGTLPGQTSAGAYDAFVRKYDSAGAEEWTRQFGSSSFDVVYSVSGSGHVAGATEGTLPGQASGGDMDAFVARLNP
jgi:hypothetical protein